MESDKQSIVERLEQVEQELDRERQLSAELGTTIEELERDKRETDYQMKTLENIVRGLRVASASPKEQVEEREVSHGANRSNRYSRGGGYQENN